MHACDSALAIAVIRFAIRMLAASGERKIEAGLVDNDPKRKSQQTKAKPFQKQQRTECFETSTAWVGPLAACVSDGVLARRGNHCGTKRARERVRGEPIVTAAMILDQLKQLRAKQRTTARMEAREQKC